MIVDRAACTSLPAKSSATCRAITKQGLTHLPLTARYTENLVECSPAERRWTHRLASGKCLAPRAYSGCFALLGGTDPELTLRSGIRGLDTLSMKAGTPPTWQRRRLLEDLPWCDPPRGDNAKSRTYHSTRSVTKTLALLHFSVHARQSFYGTHLKKSPQKHVLGGLGKTHSSTICTSFKSRTQEDFPSISRNAGT